MRMSCLVGAVLVAAVSAQQGATSRPDSAAPARRPDPRAIAWAAFEAAPAESRSLEASLPLLLARLRGFPDSPERGCAALQVLDRMLAAGLSAALADVEPFLGWPETRRPALVLLARAPQRNAAFFAELFASLAPSEGSHEWVLAGNVLAKARAPGFVAKVLRGVTVTVTSRSANSSNSPFLMVSHRRSRAVLTSWSTMCRARRQSTHSSTKTLTRQRPPSDPSPARGTG
jgi:hypothetical protein